MESRLKRTLTLRNLTLAVVPEVILVAKLCHGSFSFQGHLLTMIFSFLAVNYATWVVVWLYLWPRFFSPLRHIPGPRAFISATVRVPFLKDRPGGELFQDIADRYPGQDLVALNKFGSMFLISTPRLLSDLCVQRCYDFGKPEKVISFLHRLLGRSLPMLEGDQHRFMRRKTNPAFHFRSIRNLYPMMWEKSEQFARALRKELYDQSSQSSEQEKTRPAMGVVEFGELAGNVTLDVIGLAGMGHDFEAIEKGHHPLIQAFDDFLEPTFGKVLYWVIAATFGYSFTKMLPWKMHGTFDGIRKSVHDNCFPLIPKKRQAVADNPEDHLDILSILIKSGGFSDEELLDQLLTTVAAGQETTAASITWACYLLAKHPDVQVKLREEVTRVCPDSSSDLGQTLEQLPYLNGILQETLRLYPSIPMTWRMSLHDTFLGSQYIPKNTFIVISVWLINRSRESWGEDAETCRPERWINEDGRPNQTGGTKSNYNFLTFLHGPRNCIGGGFAKAEVRCLLAVLVSKFSWELVDDEKKVPSGTLTVRPNNGMHLRFTAL